MRGNAACGSHNVTHKYRESESICTYARARANATGFPGSLYRGAAHLLSRQVCAVLRDHTDDGSPAAKLLTPGLHPFLVNVRRVSLRPAAVVHLDQETRSRCADRGNKSSNRHGSRSAAPIPARCLPSWERGITCV